MCRGNSGISSHFLSFAKFVLVGAATAAIYFVVMWFFDSILEFKYLTSVSAAYVVSTGFHFLGSRHFTFVATQGRQNSQFIRYMALWIINYLITILVVGFSVEQLSLSPYIGVCVAVLFTMCTGYVMARYWVFKVKKEVV